MPYALQYTTASGKYVSYPAIAIASGENFSIECVASIDATGIVRLIGNPSGTFTSRAWLQQNATPNVRLTNAAGASADWNFSFVIGTYYKIRFVRTGSTLELFIDNTSQGTRTLSGSFSFEWFFAQSTTFGAACTVRYFEFISNAGTRLYRNDSGTGSIWPDVNNSSNNATQVGTWPANDSEWIFYSSGATNYTDTLLAGSYAHSGSLLNSSVGYSSELLAGSYTHSGSVLGSAVGYSSALQAGAFSYSGSELQSIISNGAQNYSDTLLGGSFTHSGSALQSAIARSSTLLAGSYSHAGSTLSASLAFYSTLNGGAYSHFGSMLQSTISGQVTVSIEGYTITFATDTVSGAFAADTVAATFINDYVSATWSN